VIHLPPGVPSESVFIRYVLAGEKLGGWVQPKAGISAYTIDTLHDAIPATGIKAIVYAPGCALEAVDLRLAAGSNSEYAFSCKPLGEVQIAGRLLEAQSLRESGARIQARYIARWAHNFLGLTDDTVLVIPLGETTLSADGSFHLAVPNLYRDRLAGGSADGELELWARDNTDRNLLGMLIAPGATRFGGMKIASEYPAETTFKARGITRRPIHDNGFARRSDLDGCRE
jgi:hypothetical protein